MKKTIFLVFCSVFLSISCSGKGHEDKAPKLIADTCYGLVALYFPDSARNLNGYQPDSAYAMSDILLFHPDAAEAFDTIRFRLQHYSLNNPQFGKDVVFDGDCYTASTTSGTRLDPYVFIQGKQSAAASLENLHTEKMAKSNDWDRTHIFSEPIYNITFKVYGDLDGDWLYVILDKSSGKGAYIRYDKSRMTSWAWVSPKNGERIGFKGGNLYKNPSTESEVIEMDDKSNFGRILSVEGDWLKVSTGRNDKSQQGWVRWKDKDGNIPEVAVVRAIY